MYTIKNLEIFSVFLLNICSLATSIFDPVLGLLLPTVLEVILALPQATSVATGLFFHKKLSYIELY